MDKAGSEKSIIALEGWLQTPAGVYMRAWEQSCLDNLTADIFGFNAVQIGMPKSMHWPPAACLTNCWPTAKRARRAPRGGT
jgi:hypothetical protein